jgi:hypothetical protein
MTEEILQDPALSAKERLPWHKPDVRRLTIAVDTQNSKGSTEDSVTYGPEVPR